MPVSAAAIVLDLSKLFNQPANEATAYGKQQPGVQDNRVILFADGVDLGIITGTVIADVTGANAPVLAHSGSVSGTGIYTLQIGTCYRVLNGQSIEFEPSVIQDVILGIVASGAGHARLFQCSGTNA